MVRKFGFLTIGLLALSSLVLAQNAVDGKWAGEVQGGRGPQQITVTLKAEGSTLTGSVLGGRGGEIAIKEGTISGSTIKFKTTQMGRGGAQTVVSKAKWDGASLVIESSREIQGMSITTTEVRTLDSGGKEMKVQTTIQTPQGEQKRNVVYTKS